MNDSLSSFNVDFENEDETAANETAKTVETSPKRKKGLLGMLTPKKPKESLQMDIHSLSGSSPLDAPNLEFERSTPLAAPSGVNDSLSPRRNEPSGSRRKQDCAAILEDVENSYSGDEAETPKTPRKEKGKSQQGKSPKLTPKMVTKEEFRKMMEERAARGEEREGRRSTRSKSRDPRCRSKSRGRMRSKSRGRRKDGTPRSQRRSDTSVVSGDDSLSDIRLPALDSPTRKKYESSGTPGSPRKTLTLDDLRKRHASQVDRKCRSVVSASEYRPLKKTESGRMSVLSPSKEENSSIAHSPRSPSRSPTKKGARSSEHSPRSRARSPPKKGTRSSEHSPRSRTRSPTKKETRSSDLPRSRARSPTKSPISSSAHSPRRNRARSPSKTAISKSAHSPKRSRARSPSKANVSSNDHHSSPSEIASPSPMKSPTTSAPESTPPTTPKQSRSPKRTSSRSLSEQGREVKGHTADEAGGPKTPRTPRKGRNGSTSKERDGESTSTPTRTPTSSRRRVVRRHSGAGASKSPRSLGAKESPQQRSVQSVRSMGANEMWKELGYSKEKRSCPSRTVSSNSQLGSSLDRKLKKTTGSPSSRSKRRSGDKSVASVAAQLDIASMIDLVESPRTGGEPSRMDVKYADVCSVYTS